MGTIRNRMTIVSHFDLGEITEARESAVAYFENVLKNGYSAV